jgi:hypothetical protein
MTDHDHKDSREVCASCDGSGAFYTYDDGSTDPCPACAKPSPLDEALAAWRRISEKHRANVIACIDSGTPLYDVAAEAVVALLRAASVRP